jgi:hypothetical protein
MPEVCVDHRPSKTEGAGNAGRSTVPHLICASVKAKYFRRGHLTRIRKNKSDGQISSGKPLEDIEDPL